MKHKTIIPSSSLEESNMFVEGCVNDFLAGLSSKEEFMRNMGDYTGRLMDIFWQTCKKLHAENPKEFE